MLQSKVFVGELFSVDRLASRPVAAGEIAALDHEVGDNSVKLASLKSESLFSGAKSAEVLGSFGDDIGKKIEDDATSRSTIDGNVKINLWSCHFYYIHGRGRRENNRIILKCFYFKQIETSQL